MPSRSNFDVVDMKLWVGSLNLVDVERNPLNFRYRVYGTKIANALRKELTGHTIDDVSPYLVKEIRKSYEWVVKTRAPYYQRSDIIAVQVFFRFHRLLLPLSDDDTTVTQILVGNTPIKDEIAEHSE